MSTRKDIQIPCHGEIVAAWLSPAKEKTSTTAKTGPAIFLAHGLGAIKEMRLDAYSERFSQAGYTCIAFDYRCSGASTDRIGIFDSSFGGGNVIMVASRDSKIKAVISQCPFTDGFHSALTTGVWPMPKLLYLGLKDYLFGTDEKPATVPLMGSPGEAALMNAHGVIEACMALMPKGYTHPNAVPARFILEIPFLRPGAYAKLVRVPIFFAICGRDTVAPAQPTLAWAKTAPEGTIQWYHEIGHFDIYLGQAFEKVTKDYLHFLSINLPV